MGFFTKPSGLLERFPAASEVTKQTTNDNITKTNLFRIWLILFSFTDAKVRQKSESGIMLSVTKFSKCIMLLFLLNFCSFLHISPIENV
jgi:hypothetical protein